MSRLNNSTNNSTRKSGKKSRILSRQLDLLGGIYQAGLKYQPKELAPCKITDPKTFKYKYIKIVHLELPQNENSIDTKKAIMQAQRMTNFGKDGMLIIRKVSKKP